MAKKVKTIIEAVTVVLNLPVSVSLFILFIKSVIKAMTGNTYFTALATKVTTMSTDLATLEAAEVALGTKPPTTTKEARDAALDVVMSEIRILRYDVQVVANANPTKAQQIILSAGLDFKKYSAHTKRGNSAENDTERGYVLLTGEGAGQHDWRYSEDEIQWHFTHSSRGASNRVGPFESGKEYSFQNRAVLTKGEFAEWSPSVKLRIK